jgi:hypothetical protein
LVVWGVTLGSAIWQRISGPTYPIRVRAEVGGAAVRGKLLRTHSVTSGQPVVVAAPDTAVDGIVRWRRMPSEDPWQYTPMARDGSQLTVTLPPQPMAGKIAYRIQLSRPMPGFADSTATVLLPVGRDVVTRFKGDVPLPLLLAHILLIFLAMLWSTRAGLAALVNDPGTRRHVALTCTFLIPAGLILGPLVQKAAFGEWWTGWPFGHDLTDNKTALAAVLWLYTLWRMRGGRRARGLVIAAAVITFAIFVIPHSTAGSEYDYGAIPVKGPVTTGH